ncbi:glycosyltransferase family 2 protein [Candidatus Micrarchaeota archaeon]|nr:glycosyltransferase family 2 protein [Candidatus Micrarchaeota archaeon]
MSLEISAGKPRPIVTALVVVAIAAIIFFSISRIGYFWVMLAPNLVLLLVTLVMLFAFFEKKPEKKMAPKDYPRLTVILPVHNAQETIEKAIERVRNSDYPYGIEVIAVDDASTDSSPQILAKLKGVKVLTMKKNVGKAAALNAGAKLAKGEVIAFVDADSYVEKTAFKHAVEAILEDDEIGAATCFIRVADANKSILRKVQEIEYYTGFGFAALASHLLDAIFVTPGPTTVFRKTAFEKIHGFDEHNITEDLEMAWRLRRHGFGIAYSPDSIVYTEVPDTIKALYRQRLRWYRGKLFNVRKYSDMLFNKKYGNFGLFMLPGSFSAEFAGIVLSFSFVYLLFRQAAWLASYLASSLAVGTLSLDLSGFALVGTSAIAMGAVIVIPWIFALYLSYGMAGRKFGLRQVPQLFLFLFFYGTVVSFFYCASFIKEVNRSDYKWK